MSFLGEIKRRKVFKVAAVYAVVAWLIIQIVATVEEPLSLPGWFDTAVIVLLAVGFPIAIILAWAFDLTPHGIKSATDREAGNVPAQTTGQRFSYISQAMVLLAVGFLVVDQYVFDDSPPRSTDATRNTSAAQGVVRFAMIHPGSQSFNGASNDSKVALSPDGRHIAYLIGARPSAILPLYIRSFDRLEPTLLSNSARSPFFSPDSQWIGFVEDNRQLSKVSIAGGPSMPIANLDGSIRGATWAMDDTIIFATNDSSIGLQRIPSMGGEIEELTTPNTSNGEIDHVFPAALPEDRGVLFTITSAADSINNSQIAVLDFETGEYRALIRGGSYGIYSESGHIIYSVAGTLRAVPFDLQRLTVMGDPVPVLDEVVGGSSGSAGFSLALNGTLAYLTGTSLYYRPPRSLIWIDREGREEPLDFDANLFLSQKLSPDGKRVAISLSTAFGASIWIYDLQRSTASRLTFNNAANFGPLWTSNGQRVAYSKFDGGNEPGIFLKAADGTGQAETLVTGQRLIGQFFTPDGEWLVTQGIVDGYDIQVVSLGDGATNTLIGGQGNQKWPSLSPDGRWIAYESDENGASEIYVRPFPDVENGKWQVSRSGGEQPQWNPTGRELFFIGPEEMMVAAVETEPTVSLGIPKSLFPVASYVNDTSDGIYSVSPDGLRFLMYKPASGSDSIRSSLIVVQNWFEELNRLVPIPE
jgi:serine/threonine-protein kinase